jgi:hypothetical protein
MCDKCGTIFSERVQGWARGTVEVLTTDERGRSTTITEQRDTCDICTASGSVVRPTIAAIAASVPTIVG